MSASLSPGDLVGCTLGGGIQAVAHDERERHGAPGAWRMLRGELGFVLATGHGRALVLSLGRLGWVPDLWLEAL